MNGHASEYFQTDCALANCHWTCDPQPNETAAREARRKHLSDHTHGDLVEHVAAQHSSVARYTKEEKEA